MWLYFSRSILLQHRITSLALLLLITCPSVCLADSCAADKDCWLKRIGEVFCSNNPDECPGQNSGSEFIKYRAPRSLYRAGKINLNDGSMIPEVSGITLRARNEIYLVSDDNRWLYYARFANGYWSVDRFGISSPGYGLNNVGIYDIEDVTYGPCPDRNDGQCIFIGEIGGKYRHGGLF